MRYKLQKPKSQGFTIIEVMIVLAIAALILLIVLLAVPALQRNSRNTTIKNDVGSVAGAINTYESDNNGTPPTYIDGTGTITVGLSATDTNNETFKVNGSTKVSQAGAATGGGVAIPTSVTPGNIVVVFGQTCPASLGGSGQGSTRAAALFYSVETSGNNKLSCSDT